MGAAFLLLSVAQGLWLVAAALMLWGAAASVYHPAGLALISRGARRRGHVFAYHGIAGNLGTAFGPLAATLLLLVLDWRIVSALLALPALGALPLLARLDINLEAGEAVADEQPQGARSWGSFARASQRLLASAFVLVLGVAMLQGLYYRGVLTFLPELLDGMPSLSAVQVGTLALQPGRYVYVGLLLVGVGGQYLGGRLTDRVRPEKGMLGAFALLAVIAAVFLPAAAAGLGPLLGVSAALGLVLFGIQPLYQAAIAEYTPAGARGLSYGYTYLGVFGVGALGAALAGGVLGAFGAAALFGVLALLATSAAGLTLVLVRRTRREAA